MVASNWEWLGERGGYDYKGWHEKDLWGDEIVLYFDLGRGYMNLYVIKKNIEL